MDQKEELEEQVRRLSRTVEDMRAQIVRLEGQELRPDNGSARSSRRGFLRVGAAAAAGALGWAAVRAVPAAAATGGNMLLGCANLAENTTTLQADTTFPHVLGVEAQNFVPGDLTAALATFGESF